MKTLIDTCIYLSSNTLESLKRRSISILILSLLFASYAYSSNDSSIHESEALPIDPIAVCKDINITLDYSGTKAITGSNIDNGSDDPDGAIVSYTADPDFFTCDDLGVNVVTLTVEDNDGNTATCTANVTVFFPSQALACFAELYLSLDSDGNGTLTVEEALADPIIDPCGLAYVTPSTFDCNDIGTNYVEVHDGVGNFCWMNVIVEDKIPPSFIFPADITLECNGNTDPSVTGEPVIIDNCDENYGFAYEDLVINLPGNNIKILRTWSIIDWITLEIVTYIQIIKTADNQPPTAICQTNINISLDQFGNATLPPEAVDVGSFDDCGDVSLTVSPNTFDCSDVGNTIQVVLFVTDENGNSNQCFSNVLIEDKTAPTAVCNAQVNVSLDANGMATITPADIDAGSYDNCGPLTYALDQTMFDCTDIGENIIVILTVTDGSGNTNQCWSQIIVEDKMAPDVTCPADITLDCADGDNLDPSITGSPFVVDNCDLIGYSWEDLVLQLGGGSFKVLRTWTIVDWNSGSIQECIQIIKVLDTTPPNMVCANQVSVSLDNTGSLTLSPEALVESATDDCSTVTLELIQNQFDCGDIGDTTVLVNAYDENGNLSQCLVDVTIEDKTGPYAACNAFLNVSLGVDGTATITPEMIDAGSDDACGPVTLSLSQTMFDCSDIGANVIVTMTVTDGSGNTNQCWSEITVEDNLGPDVTCPPDLTLDCSLGDNLDPSITGYPIVVDNCDQIGMAWDDQIFQQGGQNFKVLRTWDIVDWNSGVVVECIQIIKVLDTTPPNMVCLNALAASLDVNGNLTLFPEDFDAGTTDDCGTFELTISQSEFDCDDVGQTIITVTAIDDTGNESQCMVTLTISGFDGDGDGFNNCGEDCNDDNDTVYPGAPELCDDNLDNNCDGEVDEDCICPSYGESTQNEWIESIEVNAFNNNSGDDGGYGDYTSLLVSLNQGTNTLQLNPGFSGSKRKEYWSVWIDLNQNGAFENSENVFQQNSKNAINGSFNIPVSADLGETTMRVAMKFNAYSDPCELFPEGEVEDYTVVISGVEYCDSEGQSTEFEWIKKVQLKSINNTSGDDNGYADFTYLSTNLNPGQSKNIKMQPGFSGSSYVEYWSVWVDWNADGDFDDAGELELQTSSSGNVNGVITVPGSASGGDKIMRVSMSYDGYPSACGSFAYGEVEDYTIFVTGNNPYITANDPINANTLHKEKSESPITNDIEKREFDISLDAQLYPSPAYYFINVDIQSDIIGGECSIKLFNQTGQIVHQLKTKESKNRIDISDAKFVSGMYMVTIQQNEKVINKRILVSK